MHLRYLTKEKRAENLENELCGEVVSSKEILFIRSYVVLTGIANALMFNQSYCGMIMLS